MAKFSTEDLRNVGVIGHGGTGKTTLVSACLYASGMMGRLGKVEDGSAVTDFDPEEVERQISIQTALAHCDWKKRRVTFLDTPGYAVFRADTKAAMRVADSALVVVDALSGAEVMTEKGWEYVQEFRTPAIFVVNRLDRENSSFERAVESCQEVFGREVVPVQLPIGEAQDFSGVVDLVHMTAYEYERDGEGKGKRVDIPDDLREAAESARESLSEMVAESDEELMEAYFEAGELTQEQLEAGIADAVREMRLFPVLCASAAHNEGTDRILDACVDYLPSPADREQPTRHDEDGAWEWAELDPDGPFAALVFKTISDPFAGHITYMKVLSGAIESDAHVFNARTEQDERLAALSEPQGKELEHVDEAVTGELCAVTKLKDTATGDTLRAQGCELVYDHVEFPQAAISFAIAPASKSDEEKIGTALHRLLEEDPTLHIDRDSQTHETLLSGLGQLHVEVALSKLKNRFGVDATLKPPKVAYRETITTRAEAEGRHKKQSGGRGQFGVAVIALEPLPSGSGFEFEDKIFGGSISQQYRPAVEKGIIEAAQKGVLAGYPMVDFKVELLDGKEHSVDSSEMAFKIAGSLAFKQAAPRARPVLLEPIMKLEINVPDESMGDVIGDLNSRRGRVQGMDPRKGRQIVKAEAPAAEVLSYGTDLNSLTGGRGTYTVEFARYEQVPPNVAQKIIEKAKRADDEDEG
ncbi:MAG: elongation factor G [Acidobacteriota bacterium]